MSDLSWITEGADVIAWSWHHTSALRARRATIVKVNAKSFKIDIEDRRYPIDAEPVVNEGYAAYRVAPMGSERANEIVRRSNLQARADAVEDGIRAWENARRQQDGEEPTPALEQAAEALISRLQRYLDLTKRS